MNVEHLINKGSVALNQGKLERALQCFTQVDAVLPGNPSVLSYRGVALSGLGRYEAALDCFERASAVPPERVDVRRNMGFMLLMLNRREEALAQVDRALALDPDDTISLNTRGLVLHTSGFHTEALACFDRALAVDPAYVDAMVNRAATLNALGRYEERLACLDRAVAINPAHIPALQQRSDALSQLQRVDEALTAIEQGLGLSPKSPDLLFRRGVARLLQGDLAAGFQGLESRWDVASFNGIRFGTRRRLWLGRTPLAGKTILLHGEQGLGDVLQFVRYAPMVAARGARVILRLGPSLVSLLKSMPGVAQVIAEDEPVPAHDLHCPLMSLPAAFGTTLETIPAQIPYLKADPSRIAFWKERLGPRRGPRIGLAWAGNGKAPYSAARDIALRRLLPLLDLPVEFVSLQKEIPGSDLAVYGQARNLVPLGESLSDFADTAALVENLDLVISVDTSVAHLAGALGRPVWLMNRLDTCWRWLLGRDDSPWYPTLRQFRQRRIGDWEPVVGDVARALAAFAPAGSSNRSNETKP